MIVACIALTVALGGTSYAAIRLPAGSVGTKQLKRGAVTGVKVKGNALGGVQINEARLARVPRAALADRASDAATADTADQATRAPVSRLDYRQSAAVAIPSTGTHVRATAGCDTGLNVVGGGAKVSDPESAIVVDSNPAGRTGWEATAAAGAAGTTLTVFVICAQTASATP
jgi:hypothetical protein